MRKYSVLIVEDERIVSMDLQQTLAGLGYDAYAIASSADEAFARAAEKHPDVVLMDIRIKGKTDGVRTAEIFRDKFDVPVVYLTAHADNATIARAKKTTPHGYILKPVKTAELKSAIEVAIYKHGVEKELRVREAWLEETLATIDDSVLTVDAASRIVQMNAAAEVLTGWRQSEARGELLAAVLSPKAAGGGVESAFALELSASVNAVLGDGISRDGEGPQVRDDRTFGYSVTPLSAELGLVLGAVIVLHDVTEQRRSDSEIRRLHLQLMDLAMTDALTGIANYRAFQERLRQLVAEGERGRTFAMAFCDIDNFKGLNDSLGHQAGDQVLMAVAGVLKSSVRATDFVARHGGDEFCILFTDVTEEMAVVLTEKLRRSIGAIRQPNSVTASFGVCAYSKTFEGDCVRFSEAVDSALYLSKRRGRNRVTPFDLDARTSEAGRPIE